jgi:uncharacterized membrane protein
MMLWSAVVSAFFQASSSLALAAGVEGHHIGIGAVLSEGIRRMLRIVLANLLVIAVIALPVVGLIVIGSFTSRDAGASRMLYYLLPLITIIWTIIAMLRYSLAAYIALFEPELPLFAILSRSNQLLKGGGQWFVVKGVLLIFLVAIIMSIVTRQSLSELTASSNLGVVLVFLIMSLLANGSMLMLYRNRKAVKDLAVAPSPV